MSRVGFSKPYAAIYSNSGSVVSYTSGASLGKAISGDISLNDSGDNVLYGDNGPIESDDQFTGGDFKIETDNLDANAMKNFLGMEEAAISTTDYANFTTTGAKWYKNNNNQSIPYLGFGGVVKKILRGATKYFAVVLLKIKPSDLAQAFNTQGESIEWQTDEINAKILRSDTATQDWRWISSDLETEAEAEALVKGVLNIT